MILIAGGAGELLTLSPLLLFASVFLMAATASLVPIGNARLEPCSEIFDVEGVTLKIRPPYLGGLLAPPNRGV